MDKENSVQRHIGVFNLIAPIYGLFYNFQKRLYGNVLDKIQGKLDLSLYREIIDVGCGTGALCAVLHQRGFVVTGVDPAPKMLDIAEGKQENEGVRFVKASATETLPFEDKSFDIAIASYVAHGLQARDRKKIYSEMGRVSRYLVIIHDYNNRWSPLTSLVEWFEGGDYFNFKKNAETELKNFFGNVQVINVFFHGAWYVSVPTGSN